VQHRFLAHRRDVAQRLGGHGQPVADPAARDHDMVGAADRDPAFDEGDHEASAAASGAPFVWQIATASASAA
jgi:hypothetical protein